jgi:hypothetical protein
MTTYPAKAKFGTNGDHGKGENQKFSKHFFKHLLQLKKTAWKERKQQIS